LAAETEHVSGSSSRIIPWMDNFFLLAQNAQDCTRICTDFLALSARFDVIIKPSDLRPSTTTVGVGLSFDLASKCVSLSPKILKKKKKKSPASGGRMLQVAPND
jgi:hypothetical protein